MTGGRKAKEMNQVLGTKPPFLFTLLLSPQTTLPAVIAFQFMFNTNIIQLEVGIQYPRHRNANQKGASDYNSMKACCACLLSTAA